MSNAFKNPFDQGNGRYSHPQKEPGVSGRRFVVVAVAVVFVGTILIRWRFQIWRQNFQERMKLGNREVVAAVEPLEAILPNDGPVEDEQAWKSTVQQTQAMLRSVVASNMLDESALTTLGADLRTRVAKAQPETVRRVLSDLWDEVARKTSPRIARSHPKPPLLKLRSTGSLVP